mgnify:CR=1 FL=1
MNSYYSDKLNSNNLKRCYEIAPDRIKQFLEAEIEYTLSKIRNTDTALDLGCGYGRVAERLAVKSKEIIGIDISKDNIDLANRFFARENASYLEMNASNLKFNDNTFDITLCLQNGISAFKLEPLALIRESLRVTKKGGLLLISTYSDKIWDARLKWFELQANEGLIGDIDYQLTKNGCIVCKDNFTATTYTKDDFTILASHFDVEVQITEYDNSILFCEMVKK